MVERARIETVIELCRKARERLQSRADAPFRLCVLLELGKELARIGGDKTA